MIRPSCNTFIYCNYREPMIRIKIFIGLTKNSYSFYFLEKIYIKKVIFGKNGCIVIIDNKGICETCFKPKKGIDYYESNAITKYDSIKNKGIKKWLEKLLLKF
jgi:hypothetical protein